jgi:hypothetical protein
MNPKLIELALDAGLINYVDNETPRHYFISAHTDTQDLEEFAQGLVRYLVDKVRDTNMSHLVYTSYDQAISESCKHAIVRKLEELL